MTIPTVAIDDQKPNPPLGASLLGFSPCGQFFFSRNGLILFDVFFFGSFTPFIGSIRCHANGIVDLGLSLANPSGPGPSEAAHQIGQMAAWHACQLPRLSFLL